MASTARGTHHKGPIDSVNGFKVNGTSVLTSAHAGTATASEAAVLGTAKNLDILRVDAFTSGVSGTAGSVKVFPSTASKGSLRLLAVDSAADYICTISNASLGQSSVVSIPDPGAATAKFLLDTGTNASGTFTAATITTLTMTSLASGATATEINLAADQSLYTESLTSVTPTMSLTKRAHLFDSTLGAQALTPAAPGAANIGVIHTLSFEVDNGDVVITATNMLGLQKTTDLPGAGTGATFTMTDVGNNLVLIGVSSTKWQVLAHSGGTVA